MKNNTQKKFDGFITSETISYKYREDHFLTKTAIGVFLLIATLVLDFFVLIDFVTANRIAVGFSVSGISGIAVALTFLLVLDVSMPALVLMIKRQSYRVEKVSWPLAVLVTLMLVTFVVLMVGARWSLVTPDTLSRGSRTYTQAVIFGLLPVGTSITSAAVFWISYNPLLKRMENCEQRIFSDGEKLREKKIELARYEADTGSYKARLEIEEYLRYKQKFEEIKVVAGDLKAYFRRKLAEKLADPRAITVLSSKEFHPSMDDVEMLERFNP